ncbi:MAG: Crp/Fnr family transcriptional regulator [Gammaproteobacteria bacterium]|nr:Crp/Fnr family transcriptional regulator [Gammaproteobacteria bacterium]
MLKADLAKGLMFARLTEAQLERVAAHAVRVRVDDGEMLFRQDDPAQRFYLLLRGQIKLFRLGPSGNEKVIEVVSPVSTFAEALMFLERPTYPVGAQALQPAEVISIDSTDFTAMLRESVDTCFLLMGDMSQRLRGLIREIDNLSLSSATCRVAAYLLAKAPAGSGSFELDIPKQTLASRLSVQPETFSRIIRNLSNQGLLTVSGAHVEISDRARLEAIASASGIGEDSLASTFHYAGPATTPGS